jgi:lactate permease
LVVLEDLVLKKGRVGKTSTGKKKKSPAVGIFSFDFLEFNFSDKIKLYFMFHLSFLLAIFPFFVFLVLLFWKKMALLKVSFITLFVATFLIIFYWQILPAALFSAYVKGLLVAFDILIIVLGTLFFLEVSRRFKIIENITYYLEGFSKDYRVRIILLSWFLENFLEGTAGFGAPSMVVAPLLIGMGIPILKAVILALLGNSASVVFGAAGTPIRVGFADLETSSVPFYAAFFNLAGVIVPVFMLWIATLQTKNQKEQFLEGLPFALWSGFSFWAASLITVPLGQEFPSIAGSLIGLFFVVLTLKLRIFIPPKIRQHPEYKPVKASLPAFKVFLPYLFLIILLVLGKIFLGQKFILAPFGFPYKFNLFNPGFAFILAGFLMIWLWPKKEKIAFQSLKEAFQKSFEPFLVIFAMSAFVQTMIFSGDNLSGFSSSIEIISQFLRTNFLPFLVPFLGALGSFLTGSATISNIMFGNIVKKSAELIGFQAAPLLGLLVVGGAAGNMIALADILVTEAAVGLKHQERQVIKGVIGPCLLYLFLVGIMGIFFMEILKI